MAMILIGRYLSPFVRRVAIALHRLNLPFEHRPLSVLTDFPAICGFNPLGRVPVLVLEDGEVLVDSAAILDYLDELVGPAQALIPPSGAARRAVLRIEMIAQGVLEKAVATYYELGRRPADLRWAENGTKLTAQTQGGLAALEAQLSGDWLVGGQFSRADLSAAVALPFIQATVPDLLAPGYPKLTALGARLEVTAPFQAAPIH